MKEYILCIILGIILYFIIQDSINKFSIGAISIGWRELKPNKNVGSTNNNDYNYYYYIGSEINTFDDIYTILRQHGHTDPLNLEQITDFPSNLPIEDMYDIGIVNHNGIEYHFYEPTLRRENRPQLQQFGTNPPPNVIRPVPLVQHPGGIARPQTRQPPLTRWQRFLNTCGVVFTRN